MGLRASNTVELIFEDCEIPAGNLLGNPGEGFKVAMMALDSGRIGIASQAVGIARACLAEAVVLHGAAPPVRQNDRFVRGDPLHDRKRRDENRSRSWLTLAAADRKDRGLRFTKEASMAKLFASETANAAAYMALQVHGGYGYTRDYKSNASTAMRAPRRFMKARRKSSASSSPGK